MKNKIDSINAWLDKIEKSSIPDFDKLPEVKLYMNQLVAYINEILSPYTSKDQKAITSFMVNNYVKEKLIDQPINRKYNRTQMAYIISICLLKQVASMENLHVILDKKNASIKGNELYSFFKSCETETLESVYHKTKMRVEAVEKKYKSDITKCHNKPELLNKVNNHLNIQLVYIAFKLMVEAQINKFFAEKILEEVLGKDK